MNRQLQKSTFLITLLIIINGCSEEGKELVQAKNNIVQAISTPITDQWLGTWIGPEGTFLEIKDNQHQYEITIQNLDGPRTFQGTAIGNQIEFERDGVKAFIHATNGTETGMKWLSEKTNCLTVELGEGYCRD